MTKKITSSLSKIQPRAVYDTLTGEKVSQIEHDTTLTKLIEFVQDQTVLLFADNQTRLVHELISAKSIGSANSFARQRGYRSDYLSLPREVRAKSRINELVLHKLVSETASYVLNATENKQASSFSKNINLGAVDKQMVSLSVSKDMSELSLLFKCWDKEYLIEFDLPEYVRSRNISKWCLPSIGVKNGEIYYYFSFVEIPAARNSMPTQFAGVDLGRVKAYSMAVVNSHGDRVAEYLPKGHVNALNSRRERILKEKKHILVKADQYVALGIDDSVLRKEARRKANKAMRLGEQLKWQVSSDITQKIKNHDVNTVAIENLKWANGSKYGSRWNFARQQEAIEHSLSREGISTKRVSPKNTSQSCSKCDAKIVHQTKKRTVWCEACKLELNRDFSAALNLSKKITPYPNQYSRIGGNCRTVLVEDTQQTADQVVELRAHKSVVKKE